MLLLGGETEAAPAVPAGTAGRGLLFPNGGAAAPFDDGVPLLLDELLGVEVVAGSKDVHVHGK